MIISIVSKDKISLSMFVDFYKTLYDSNVEVLDLNSLTSRDVLDTIVKEAVGRYFEKKSTGQTSLLIKLKTKKDVTLEELPQEMARTSFYIIKFDLFSTKPEILKDTDNKLHPIIERWEMNIKKLNGEL